MANIKLEYEEIPQSDKSSYRILEDVRLKDFYYWHFHPEIELVYINAHKGIRHVGDHLSTYTDGDLVLIGSGIPHLNFDYQSEGDYDMIVVHMRSDFLSKVISQAPEYNDIRQLLELATYGISFSELSKRAIGGRLVSLSSKSGFSQFLELLHIFQELSNDRDKNILHSLPYKEEFRKREQDRLKALYAFIDLNYARRISVKEASQLCHLSEEAFCRFFKKMTKLTFTEFLNHYRISQSKRLLTIGESVTDTAFSSGYESIYYYSKVFKRITGMTPTQFVGSLG